MTQLLTHVVNTLGVPRQEGRYGTTFHPVTTFESFPYNSFAEIDGKYYAAGPSGLVQVDFTEAGTLDWELTTGKMDFGTANVKRQSDFYIAMRASGDVVLTVTTDDEVSFDYLLSPLTIETLKQRRSLVGKGLRGRYWQLGLSGTDDFDFDAFNVAVFNTSRRV